MGPRPSPIPPLRVNSRDHSQQLYSFQVSFDDNTHAPDDASKTFPTSSSSKTDYAVQPSETVKSRRGRSTKPKKMPALPPPPTRSRKIIKMQPGPQEEPTAQATQENAVSTGVAESADGAVSKRKLPSVDSDEARKEARKDAHSEIERRRRSKTNGAYSTLEELIPACAEEELTKLGILEETIKYVRYLQDCNRKLVEHCKGYGEDDGNDADDEEYEEETRQGAGMTNLKGPLHAHTGTLTQTARNTKKRRRSHFSASTKGPHLSYTSPATSSSSFSLQANPERTDASTMERVLHSPAVTCQQQQQQQQQDEESLRVASAALANLKSDRRGTSNGESSNFLRRISINDIVGPHNGN